MNDTDQLIDGVMTYEGITDGIKIRVQNYFLDAESDPDEGHYFWAYRIEISNTGTDTAQLVNRHWIITDGLGQREEVTGPGVIGEQPILSHGEAFTYTSGCPLNTSSGFMMGHYEMVRTEGENKGSTFLVEIPAFSLDSPYQQNSVN